MRGTALALAVALGAAACDTASTDPGTSALFFIPDAQFVPGPMPADRGGPRVTGINNDHSRIRPGTSGERIQGALESHATGVAIGFPGDKGHWVLSSMIPDVVAPDLPSFEVRAAYAAEFPLGPFAVAVQASDAQGVYGPPATIDLEAIVNPPPEGELVFSLSWSHNVDLDIHVVLPDGVEVWSGNPNSFVFPPAGVPIPDPQAPLRGGIFQGDSNGQCAIDGRRQENVIWRFPAPPGRYLVRVDTFSMCKQSYASWDVQVLQRGALLARAQGQSRPSDTRHPHGAGGGMTALEIDVP